MTAVPKGSNGEAMQCLYPSVAQKISIASTSARSSAFSTNCSVIMLYSDVPCYYKLGSSTVEATTSDFYLPSGIMLMVSIDPPGADKDNMATNVAVIRASSDGNLFITEMQ